VIRISVPGFLPDRVQHWLGDGNDNLLSIERPCEHCEATGTVTETRPRRLDELTQLQMSFLREADNVREGRTEEAKQKIEEAKRKANNPSHGGSTPMTPSGRPPRSR